MLLRAYRRCYAFMRRHQRSSANIVAPVACITVLLLLFLLLLLVVSTSSSSDSSPSPSSSSSSPLEVGSSLDGHNTMMWFSTHVGPSEWIDRTSSFFKTKNRHQQQQKQQHENDVVVNEGDGDGPFAAMAVVQPRGSLHPHVVLQSLRCRANISVWSSGAIPRRDEARLMFHQRFGATLPTSSSSSPTGGKCMDEGGAKMTMVQNNNNNNNIKNVFSVFENTYTRSVHALLAPSPNVISVVAGSLLRPHGQLDLILQRNDGSLFSVADVDDAGWWAGDDDVVVGNGQQQQQEQHTQGRSTVPRPVVVRTRAAAAQHNTNNMSSHEWVACHSEEVCRMKYVEAPVLGLVNVLGNGGLPELAFVNAVGELMLLQRNTSADVVVGSDDDDGVGATARRTYVYDAQRLIHRGIIHGQREVEPFSFAHADVDGDDVAELLYVIVDEAHSAVELHKLPLMQTPQRNEDDADADDEGRVEEMDQSSVLLLTLAMTARGVRRFGIPIFADFDGDGEVDVAWPIATAATTTAATTRTRGDAKDDDDDDATYFDGIRIFFGQAPSSSSSSSSSPIYSHTRSSTYMLTPSACGLKSMPNIRDNNTRTSLSTLPLLMPHSRSSPLILRNGDVNGDGRVDLVVPSTAGPLVLMSASHNNNNNNKNKNGVAANDLFTCTVLDPTQFHQPPTNTAEKAELRAYLDALPFLHSVETAGRLDVLLTPPHRRASSSPPPSTIKHSLTTVLHHTNTTTHVEAHDEDDDVGVRVYTRRPGVEPGDAMRGGTQGYFLRASLTGSSSSSSSATTTTTVAATSSHTHGVGAPRVAAAHRLHWQDSRMRAHAARLTQGGYSSGRSLALPWMHVGLGETFSYVHDYVVSMMCDGGVQMRLWPSSLVPNSAITVVANPASRPRLWRLEQHLPASQYRWLLVLWLGGALAVMGVVAAMLQWAEIRADLREWRAHLM